MTLLFHVFEGKKVNRFVIPSQEFYFVVLAKIPNGKDTVTQEVLETTDSGLSQEITHAVFV